MTADEDRRNERDRTGRRDPGRAYRREPQVIEAQAAETAEPRSAVPTEVSSAPADAGPAEALPNETGEAVPMAEAANPPAEAQPNPATSSYEDAAKAETLLSGEPESARDRAERGRSNFATVIALAIVVMAGALIYLFYRMSFVGPDTSGEVAALNARMAGLESRPMPDIGSATQKAASAQQAAAQAQMALAALAKRVDALATPQQPSGPNLQPQVADLQGSMADVKKSVAALQASVANLPRPDLNRTEARFSDIDSRLANLQGVVNGIPHTDLGPLTGKVDAVEARMKPLEAEMEAAQSPLRVAERRAAPVAVTAQAILEAIAAGQPFPREFHALQALGADPGRLAPLQTVAANGAPSLHDLQDDLAQLRDRITSQGTPAPSGSYMDRLVAGAGSLVQVRPLGSVVGDTPAAIVARMDDAIGVDDLSAALADWQKLPEASRTASKTLPERIRLRLDAETAARDIAVNAIGALAQPRG